ncbi:MAG: glycosyltransferase [Gemmatimonadetes bacterium]|nr:glycosyltransferase [Gemmatimonadota bacterium]
MVLPTRNRRDALERAVASVRAQTRGDWELLVVDDASDDGSHAWLTELAAADPRIRVLRHERRRGGAAARNTGIEAATGRWVAFLDDDAQWKREKLDRQLSSAGQGTDALVYGPVLAVDDAGGTALVGGRVDERAPFEALAAGNRIDTSGVLVARDPLVTVGGFDPALPRLQDWDLWLRLAPAVRFVYDDTVLARTFRVGRRISTDRTALVEAAERLAAKHPTSATLAATLGHMLLAEGAGGEGRSLLARASAIERRPGVELRRALAALSPGVYGLLARGSERLRRRAGARPEPGPEPWPEETDA